MHLKLNVKIIPTMFVVISIPIKLNIIKNLLVSIMSLYLSHKTVPKLSLIKYMFSFHFDKAKNDQMFIP